jgi:hypothetical protein
MRHSGLRTDRSENRGEFQKIQNYAQFGKLVRYHKFISLQWLYVWIHQHLHSVFQISLLYPYDRWVMLQIRV